MSGWIQWIMAGQKASTCVGWVLIFFFIGRWTHLDTLNSIYHLFDHGVGLGQFGEFRGRFWKKFYDI